MIRRLAILTTAAVGLFGVAGCASVNNSFTEQNGVCYRTRVTKTLGMQTHKETVLAVPENCGITTTTEGVTP